MVLLYRGGSGVPTSSRSPLLCLARRTNLHARNSYWFGPPPNCCIFKQDNNRSVYYGSGARGPNWAITLVPVTMARYSMVTSGHDPTGRLTRGVGCGIVLMRLAIEPNVPVCLMASGRAILYSWDIIRLASNGGDAVSDPCAAAAAAVETPRTGSLVSDLLRNRHLLYLA